MKLQFYLPTRVQMDRDCVRKNASALKGLGSHALVVTGRHSARACGALEDVEAALRANGQEMTLFDRVSANPTVECVYDGAALLKKSGADFVVAIGGGSPMDAGKAIAMVAAEDRPEEEIFSGHYEKRLPLCCIPTTAGTGSEVTQYSILTNDKAQTKTSLASPALFPDLALLDARYLVAVPERTMVNTVIDALSHSVEGYLSIKASPLTDALALEAIGLIAENLDALKKGTLQEENREQLLYASTLGGMVIAHTGTTAVHSMGYSLTYFRHIDHGRANGLLLPYFLKWLAAHSAERVAEVTAAMGCATPEEVETVLSGLLGEREEMTGEELECFSHLAIQAANIKNCAAAPSREELLDMYRAAFPRKGGMGA